MTPTCRSGLLLPVAVLLALAFSTQDHARSVDGVSDGKNVAYDGEAVAKAAECSFVITEHKGTATSTTHGFSDGAKIRLEFQDSKTADDPEGVYAISLDGGRTIYIVSAKRKEFTRADTESLKAKAIEKLKALEDKSGLQIESPKVEELLTEPGPTIAGHPTNHHRLKISYSMHSLKTDRRSTYVEYQDLYMASDIERKGAADMLIDFRTTGDARIDGAWDQQIAQMPGFPMRQVTLRTEVSEEGNSNVLRVSREITKIQTGPVEASLFVLPPGYKEVAAQEEAH